MKETIWYKIFSNLFPKSKILKNDSNYKKGSKKYVNLK